MKLRYVSEEEVKLDLKKQEADQKKRWCQVTIKLLELLLDGVHVKEGMVLVG